MEEENSHYGYHSNDRNAKGGEGNYRRNGGQRIQEKERGKKIGDSQGDAKEQLFFAQTFFFV